MEHHKLGRPLKEEKKKSLSIYCNESLEKSENKRMISHETTEDEIEEDQEVKAGHTCDCLLVYNRSTNTYLRNNVPFYKRQLWSYNLTAFKTDTTSKEVFCMLWNETLAGHGGQEIASCIRKFILLLDTQNVKTLNFYSDSSSGKNRNIYLEPGHTHMEANSIHASIERAKRKTVVYIHVSHDWSKLITTSIYRSKPLNEIEISPNDFVDFGTFLKSALVQRKKDEQGNIVPWRPSQPVQINQERPSNQFPPRQSVINRPNPSVPQKTIVVQPNPNYNYYQRNRRPNHPPRVNHVNPHYDYYYYEQANDSYATDNYDDTAYDNDIFNDNNLSHRPNL
nr:unnamed protein product [Callosobruchus chinensis]